MDFSSSFFSLSRMNCVFLYPWNLCLHMVMEICIYYDLYTITTLATNICCWFSICCCCRAAISWSSERVSSTRGFPTCRTQNVTLICWCILIVLAIAAKPPLLQRKAKVSSTVLRGRKMIDTYERVRNLRAGRKDTDHAHTRDRKSKKGESRWKRKTLRDKTNEKKSPYTAFNTALIRIGRTGTQYWYGTCGNTHVSRYFK